jgi:hypothetical protein
MKFRQIETPETKAEGDAIVAAGCFPYDTQLVSSQGVSMHFWLGDTPLSEALQGQLEKLGRSERDVVYFTYSAGHPSGYWAHQDMRARNRATD